MSGKLVKIEEINFEKKKFKKPELDFSGTWTLHFFYPNGCEEFQVGIIYFVTVVCSNTDKKWDYKLSEQKDITTLKQAWFSWKEIMVH